MSDKGELEEKLDRLISQMEELGYDIGEKYRREVEDNEILAVDASTPQLITVFTTLDDEREIFYIRYSINLVNEVAITIKQRTEGVREELDEEEDREYIKEARKKLSSHNKEDFERTRRGLIERINSPGTTYQINYLNNYAIEEFWVEAKLFPFRDSYDIKELYDSTTKVISTGTLCTSFVSHSYDLEGLVSDGEKVESEEEDNPGYIG